MFIYLIIADDAKIKIKISIYRQNCFEVFPRVGSASTLATQWIMQKELLET